MLRLLLRGFVALVATGVVLGCKTVGTMAEYPSEDTLTPGIFLEPEQPVALSAGVRVREVYDKGIKMTKNSEGFRSHLYNDAARYCTIAYGHLVQKAPCNGMEPAEFRAGVTEPRGTELLIQDMEIARWSVMTMTRVELTDGQFAALCDFVYNVGPSNLRNSTLLQVINQGDFDRVPAQFRRWIVADGREIPGLKMRREREITLFFDGLPIPRAAARLGEALSPIDIRTGE